MSLAKEDRVFALAERLVSVVETHLAETRKRHEDNNAKTQAMIDAFLPLVIKMAFPNGVPASATVSHLHAVEDPDACDKAPEGWACSRGKNHEGPCTPWPVS